MKFGDNLKKMRKKKSLSQEELAEKVRVSRQSVSKWETGDTYPEMNNLLELCKIFKCQINDLVNDSIIDIDSLDEDTLEKIVLLKKDKQDKVKMLSKIIMAVSSIARVFLILGIVITCFTLILSSIASFYLKIDKDKASLFGASITVLEEENKVEFKYKDNKFLLNDSLSSTMVKNFLNDNNKYTVVGYVCISLIGIIIYAIILYKVLSYLYKLFDNIYKGETPFTLDNVNFIKNMAHLMIAAIIVINIGGAISESLISYSPSFEFEMFDLFQILFLYSLSYIFEYGYYMQNTTNSVMYGESDE